LCCGTAWLPIDAWIAIGICYYHTLKHQARVKTHLIYKSVIKSLTKQPLKMTSKKWGLRFEEMVKDCLILHGSRINASWEVGKYISSIWDMDMSRL